MQIRFSRHARRRMKLYSIDETDVVDVVQAALLKSPMAEGKFEIVEEKYRERYRHPLKVVIAIEGETAEVITTSPLKGKKIK